MAEPTGVKRYRVVLEFDVDHDLPLNGVASTWPDDWSWELALKHGVHSVGYVELISAKEIGDES